MVSVFFSYSHVDKDLRDDLDKHLSVLQRNNIISTWHDKRMLAGQDIDPEISHYLEISEVILLLISKDFLASAYCYEIEMARALKRHEMQEARVIPVILHPCDWKETAFGGLKAVPEDGKPISEWANKDRAFLGVVEEIKRVVKNLAAQQQLVKSPPYQELPISRMDSTIRSSNLRVVKQFSDHDKDIYIRSSFEFVALYFENSIKELQSRNTDIKGMFQKIDSNRFTAKLYRDGKVRSSCTIFIGGHFGAGHQISYSSTADSITNSMNDWLNLEENEHDLCFKASGMPSFNSNLNSSGLSQQGAAEFYWEKLITPLQSRSYS